jgi:hypothetical protein
LLARNFEASRDTGGRAVGAGFALYCGRVTASEGRTNTTAVLAVVAGAVGFCFWGFGGVIAIVLGLAARREIARSEGAESGMGLASAGIVLGGLNLASAALAVVAAIALALQGSTRFAPSVAPLPAPGLPAAPTASAAAKRSAAPETATRAVGIEETAFGKIRLVDIGAGETSLRQLLEHEQKTARGQNQQLVLYVVSPNCLPCNGITLALTDSRLQTALANVRLVRIDAASYGAELLALGIPIATVPGFALVGANLRPNDYVHGGEWDADVAENIAPVLGAFVRGKYSARRHPFRTQRPDETAL